MCNTQLEVSTAELMPPGPRFVIEDLSSGLFCVAALVLITHLLIQGPE